MKILFAEDNLEYRKELTRQLESEGYEVVGAANGEVALELFGKKKFDLVLLDLDMPLCNGKVVCREIRKRSPSLPIVILTENDSSLNESNLLDLGADYFISKSDFEILFAVLRRMIARAQATGCGSDKIMVDDIAIDGSQLTKTETDLLRYFLTRRGETVSREDIIMALRGSGFACEDSLVYTHVCNLRKKLEKFGLTIDTVHARGYHFA